MATPSLKKQKIDNSISPIVFSTPCLKPDTRLTVFKQEFHVHSLVLKLHSPFFRKFLDSPDKAPNNGVAGPPNYSASTNTSASSNPGAVVAAAAKGTSSTPANPSSTDFASFGTFGVASIGQPFKYDWVTKIDQEGEWHLVCRNPKNEPYELSFYLEGETDQEISEFEKLLCAIYGRSYNIVNVDELLNLVEKADYYCVLPALSQTLDGAMVRSPEFVGDIRYRSLDLYVAAAKVRNALLFREALIWIVGPYNDPEFQQLEDRSLRSIAKSVHGELSTRVLSVVQSLLVDLHLDHAENYADDLNELVFGILPRENLDEGKKVLLPWYFRRLVGRLPEEYIDDGMLQLLQNELKLSRDMYNAGASKNDLEGHFLCATIEDQDLPWDPEEMDY